MGTCRSIFTDKEFRSYNQGLMDLGATICFKSTPKCDLCPLYSSCRARIEDITEIIPKKIKSKPPKKIQLKLTVFLNQKNQILLIKQKENHLWGGLWHLPESKNRTQTLECAKKMVLAIQTEHVMTPFKYKVSNLAQSVEQRTENPCVGSSKSEAQSVEQLKIPVSAVRFCPWPHLFSQINNLKLKRVSLR